MKKKSKHSKNEKSNKLKKLFLAILVIILICCIGYICFYIRDYFKMKNSNNEIFNNINVDESLVQDEKTERMVQIEELQKENNEVIGWLEIADTNINYPVLQSADNEYYLTHNYKKETVTGGSLFLDKNFDMTNGSSNYLIYGHRNKQGLMFEDLLKYTDKDFYNAHKTVRFTTIKDDSNYEILSIFYSRVYYKSETNVFRYYNFVNANNEQEYSDFVDNCKKASIYDTGINATYGDQLLTLSTCEYSQEDGRFVVIAKKIQK